MKLLIITQKVDKDDSNLGFFHDWLDKMAGLSDVFIIANEVGEYNLPENAKVYSLGKERKISRIIKFIRYQLLLLKLLPKSDGIFFHMCPEYVLAAGFLPKIFRKKSLIWYTHKSVNWKLRLAEKLVDKIFTASKESFRLPSKKVEVVGHGIASDLFRRPFISTSKLRLLSVGRIASVKNLEVLIRAVAELKKNFGPNVSLDIVGSTILKEDQNYKEGLKQIIDNLDLQNEVHFRDSVPAATKGILTLPDIYNAHNIFVHASETGSLDKVVLEALASGLQVFTSSEAYDDLGSVVWRFKKGDYKDLASQIEAVYKKHDKIIYNTKGIDLVNKLFSLQNLLNKIINFFKQ